MVKAVKPNYNDLDTLKAIIESKSLLINHESKFKLTSGRLSHYLFDMKPVILDPEGSNLLAKQLYEKIEDLNAGYVGGLESGAVPIVSILCIYSWKREKPLYGFFVRKKSKEHGVGKKIDGNLEPGENVIIVDDVTTTGNSLLEAFEEVKNRECKVIKAVSIVDRLEGARESLERKGVGFDSLFTKEDFGL